MFLRVEDVQGRNCLTNFWVRASPRNRARPLPASRGGAAGL